MRVLSFDPGSKFLGWAFFKNNKLIDSGCEKFKDNYDGKKALLIYGFLLSKASEYLPDHIVCEHYFFNTNNRNATLVIPEVKGIMRLVAATLGLELDEMHIGTVKKAVTGKGNSNKKQVSAAVAQLFNIEASRHDEFDAVAVGYTFIKSYEGESK